MNTVQLDETTLIASSVLSAPTLAALVLAASL
jgi:hypothetical protein